MIKRIVVKGSFVIFFFWRLVFLNAVGTVPINLNVTKINFGTNLLTWSVVDTNCTYKIYCLTNNPITEANKNNAFILTNGLNGVVSNFVHFFGAYNGSKNTNNKSYYYAVTANTNGNESIIILGTNSIIDAVTNKYVKVSFYPRFINYYGTWNDFLGITSSLGSWDITSAPDKYMTNLSKAVGWLRDYSKWYVIETNNDGWNFTYPEWPDEQAFVEKAVEQGLNILYCLEDATKFAGGTNTAVPNDNGDGTNPTNYKERAEAFAQIAARYGGWEHNSSDIEPADKIQNYGFVKYYQDYNEQTQPHGFTNAEQYGAFVNSQHDGFYWTNTPYPNLPILGLKEGDFGAQHVLGCWPGTGTTEIEWLDYIATNKWTRQAGRLPFDVLSVNLYTFSHGSASYVTNLTEYPYRPYSSCPEDKEHGLIPAWNRLETWRNQHCPDTPIWVTEFGWDTYYANNAKKTNLTGYWSPNFAFGTNKDGIIDGRIHQANYLMRGAALLAGAGAEKAFIFSDIDDKDGGSGQPSLYKNCGILYDNWSAAYNWAPGYNSNWGPYQPKPSFYYLATMKKVLGDLKFSYIDKYEEQIGNIGIYAYVFKSEISDKGAVMLWCRNLTVDYDTGAEITGYVYHLPGSPTICTQVQPVTNSMTGDKTFLTVNNSGTLSAHVTIPSITETPIFLVLDTVSFPATRPVNVNATVVEIGKNKITWDDNFTTGTYTIYAFTNHVITESNKLSAWILASNIEISYKSFIHILDDYTNMKFGKDVAFYYAVVVKTNGNYSAVYPTVNSTVDGIVNPIDYKGPYYIDVYGSDKNKGDISNPLATFAEAISRMKHGVTVCTTYVRGGIYTERISFIRNGTKNNPIVIKNYENEQPIVQTTSVFTNYAVEFGERNNKDEDLDWCIVDGLKFDGFRDTVIMEVGDNNTLINCVITNFKGSGIVIEGGTSALERLNTCSNKIINNIIAGDNNSSTGVLAHVNSGIVRDLIVYGNKISSVADGIWFNCSGNPGTNFYVIRNEFYNCTNLVKFGNGCRYNYAVQNLGHHFYGNGIEFHSDAHYNEVRNNTFYSNMVSGTFPKAIEVGDSDTTINNEIRDNIVCHFSTMAFGADGANVYVNANYCSVYENANDYGDHINEGTDCYNEKDPNFVAPDIAGSTADFHFNTGYKTPTAAGYFYCTNTGSGYVKINLGYTVVYGDVQDVTNSGNNTLEIYFRDFDGNVNWNKIAIRPEGNDYGVEVGDYTNGWGGTPIGTWKKISIPLSDFAGFDFGDLDYLSFPYSADAGAFKIGVDEIKFTGGSSPFLWYGDAHNNNSWGNQDPLYGVMKTSGGVLSGGAFENSFVGSAAPDNGIRACRGNYTFYVKPVNNTNFVKTTYTNVFTTTSVGSVPPDGFIFIKYPSGTFFDTPSVSSTSSWDGSFSAEDLGDGLLKIMRSGGTASTPNTTENLIISGVINPSMKGTNVLIRAYWWTTDKTGKILDYPDESHDYLIVQKNPVNFASVRLSAVDVVSTISSKTLENYIPGSSINYKINFVNVGNSNASNVIIYNKFPNTVYYDLNSSSVSGTNWSPSNWTNKFSTVTNPNQSYISADYSTNQIITNLQWIRTSGDNMTSLASGYFKYTAKIGLLPAGTKLTNVSFATAENSVDTFFNPMKDSAVSIITISTMYGGRFSYIKDINLNSLDAYFYNVSLTNKGNSSASFNLKINKLYSNTDLDYWNIKPVPSGNTNVITNTGIIPMNGVYNFRVMVKPLSGITNYDNIEWSIEARPNNNYTATNYIGDDGAHYGGDIGNGIDMNGNTVSRPGAIFQHDNNKIKVTVTLKPQLINLTLTNSISINNKVTNAVPGATITYKLKYTNVGIINASNVYINDILPPEIIFVSNSLRWGKVDDTFNTSKTLSDIFDIDEGYYDLFNNKVVFCVSNGSAPILGGVVLTNKSGVCYFQTYISNLSSGAVISNMGEVNGTNFNDSDTGYVYITVQAQYGGAFGFVADKSNQMFGTNYFMVSLTNKGNLYTTYSLSIPYTQNSYGTDWSKFNIKIVEENNNTEVTSVGLPMGGVTNFRVLISADETISNNSWIAFRIMADSGNTTATNYIGDDSVHYGGDIGEDVNGVVNSAYYGKIYQQGNPEIKMLFSNEQPYLLNLFVHQRMDDSGQVIIGYTGVDMQNDICDYVYTNCSYSNAGTWTQLSINTSDISNSSMPSVFPATGTNLKLVWNASNNIKIESTNMKLRIRVVDTNTNMGKIYYLTVSIDTLPPFGGNLLLSDMSTGSTNYTDTTNINISISNETDAYYWLVSEIITNKPSYTNSQWMSVKPVSFTLSTNQGPHRVYVWLKDDFNNVSLSPITNYIFLDSIIPSSVSLYSPVSNIWTNNQDITFEWSKANDTGSGISGYILNLSTNILFSSSNIYFVGSTNTNLIVNDGRWYWRVKAVDNAGNNGQYSTVWKINIDTSGPIINMDDLTNGIILYTNCVTFKWSLDDRTGIGSTNSIVYISTNEDFGNSIVKTQMCNTNICSFNTNLSYSSNWRWRILAYDKLGNISIRTEYFKLVQFNVEIEKIVATDGIHSYDITRTEHKLASNMDITIYVNIAGTINENDDLYFVYSVGGEPTLNDYKFKADWTGVDWKIYMPSNTITGHTDEILFFKFIADDRLIENNFGELNSWRFKLGTINMQLENAGILNNVIDKGTGDEVTVVYNVENDDTSINMSVYTLNGELVKVLYDEVHNRGSIIINWDGKNINGEYVGTAVYLLVIEENGKVIGVQKVMVK